MEHLEGTYYIYIYTYIYIYICIFALDSNDSNKGSNPTVDGQILHQLGWMNPMNTGGKHLLKGAGFCPSTIMNLSQMNEPSNTTFLQKPQAHRDSSRGLVRKAHLRRLLNHKVG